MDVPQSPRLLDRVHQIIRRKHYSVRTEQAYVDWIKRFIFFHDKRHPSDLGATGVEAFLTHVAVEREVSAATQNQAQSALLFSTGKSWAFNCRGLTVSREPKRRPSFPSSSLLKRSRAFLTA
jgi:hypothetical protein